MCDWKSSSRPRKRKKKANNLKEKVEQVKISASDLTAEACLMFGWTADQVLNMPATRFFSLLQSARKISQRKEAEKYVAECDIASISLGDSEYYEKIRKVFYFRAIGREDKLERRALDPTDPATVAAIESFFDTVQRMQ